MMSDAPSPEDDVTLAHEDLGSGLSSALRKVARGRYVDFRPVGEGGMGIVYWARDSDLKRQVAFKVIRPPADPARAAATPPAPQAIDAPRQGSEEAEAFEAMTTRFLQEAWVTGGMEHPGILPVYELGSTDAGVPYYTMKFIRDSRTLALALEEAGARGFEGRLALLEPFLKVCDTVRYAHSRGVIHRDLKPENIALGQFGEVVVLDWGLARLRDTPLSRASRWQGDVQELRDATGLKTVAQAVGTPGYMAPEAARGDTEAVDVRSDVYSLGVILHEILTGALPFAFKHFGEYQDLVTKSPAPDPRSVDAAISPSLAAICQTALAPNPQDRMQDVDALAEAVREWQALRAVERELRVLLGEADARLADAADLSGAALLKQIDAASLAVRRAQELRPGDEGAAARLVAVEAARERGMAQRDRLARSRVLRRVGAAVLLVASVAAVLVAGILENERREAEEAREIAAAARVRAEADRDRAEGVMGFMVGEMQRGLEPLGRLDLLAGLGQKAKAYYDDLPAEDRHPRSLRNGATALRNLGDVHFEQGDLPAAKAAYEAAVAFAQDLSEGDEGDSGYLLTQARARVSAVLIAQGYPAKAVGVLKAHLEDVHRRAALHPDDDTYQGELAEAHDLLCRAYTGTLKIELALASSKDALGLVESLAKRDDATGSWHRKVVQYLLTPARVLKISGQLEEGLARAKRALDLARSWRIRLGGDLRWARLEAEALRLTGYFQEQLGMHAEALAHYKRAREGFERLRAIDPGNMAVLHRLCALDERVGHTLYAQAAAKTDTDPTTIRVHFPAWRRAYETQSALVKKDPSNASWLHAMIGHCDRMHGMAKTLGSDEASSEAYLEEALGWARKLMEADKDVALWQHLYAYTLFQRARSRLDDDPELSYERLREVAKICQRLAPRHPPGLAELAVLNAWASEQLAQQQTLTNRERVLLLRPTLDLLALARARVPQDVSASLSFLSVSHSLAAALAPTDPSAARRLLTEALVVGRAAAPDIANAVQAIRTQRQKLMVALEAAVKALPAEDR